MLKNPKAQGILCVIGAAFFFSFMSLFVRLAGDVPLMQKMFFRNFIAGLAALFLLIKDGRGFKPLKTSWFGLFMRAIFGTLGILCNFYAITKIGLADANMLNKMSPFFAMALSVFIVKEKSSLVDWLAVTIALIGTMFIIKPSFDVNMVYGLIGLAGGFGAGMAYTYVRKLGITGERGPIIVLFFSITSCLIASPFLIFDFHPMSAQQWIFLLLAGVAAAGGQLTITKAYSLAPAKEISVFDYAQIIFATMLGAIFFEELPDIFSFIGYAIIIGVGIFKWKYNLRHEG